MTFEDLKKGMTVTYVPNHRIYERRELGTVTSWNDTYVFVDYGTGHSKATRIDDLLKGDETFYCADEHDSVLDGAFGRCATKCGRC